MLMQAFAKYKSGLLVVKLIGKACLCKNKTKKVYYGAWHQIARTIFRNSSSLI